MRDLRLRGEVVFNNLFTLSIQPTLHCGHMRSCTHTRTDAGRQRSPPQCLSPHCGLKNKFMHHVIIGTGKTENVFFFLYHPVFCFFSIEIKRKKQPQQQIKLMKSQRRGHRLPVHSHALCKWVFIHLISLLPPWEGPLVERVQGFSSSFLFCWKKKTVIKDQLSTRSAQWELLIAAVEVYMCESSNTSMPLLLILTVVCALRRSLLSSWQVESMEPEIAAVFRWQVFQCLFLVSIF